MSQSGQNGNIKSFFKPITRSQTPQPSQITTTKPPSPSPLPQSSPLSIRTATSVKQKKLLRQDVEIGASDEDDDFSNSSDDSLEDFSAILGRSRPGNAAHSPAKDIFATPRAKRKAVEFHASPLAIIPRHKFDLRALANDAKQDAATNASSLKIKTFSELVDQEATEPKKDIQHGVLADIVADNAGQDAQKVIRAVQRSQPGQSQFRYCFFLDEFEPPTLKAAPRKFGKGPWKLITQGDLVTQEQHLASGVPLTLLGIHGSLPDELFNWVLDGLCVSGSNLVRQEYCNLLSRCTEQIERLLTPGRLEQLFYRIGATPELEHRHLALSIAQPAAGPYKDRNWSCVTSFVEFLKAAAPYMSLASVIYATQGLLRMSMDKILIYNIDLLLAYQDAISALVEAIPTSGWDQFCHDTCSLLHTLFEVQCVRINALGCLPVNRTKVHELRRRLAVTFLFDNSALGRHSPHDTITMRGIIDRLGEQDFAVRPDTDFVELRASVILLNIAVDDGSFVAADNPEDERQFNDDVDELADRLREIWRKINDAGMKLARTETKSVIEWVQQRLAHSVRTHKKAKQSVFDVPGQKEDPFLPRQQDYMKSFLRKAPEPSAEEVGEDTIVVKLK